MTLNLSPRIEAALNATAQRMGVDPAALIEQMFEERFPTVETKAVPIDAEEIRKSEEGVEELMQNLNRNRIETGERPIFAPTARAAVYLKSRLQAEATDDPEEIRQAQADLDEMKNTLNAERSRSGAAPIF